MPTEEEGDDLTALAGWVNDHPGTMLYIAILVTASVALQAVLVFFR